MKDWLTTAEAAEYARTSERTVRDSAALRAEGVDPVGLKGYRSGKGGRWRFRPAAVDNWIMGVAGEPDQPSKITRRAS